jgi:glycosyltransferase involved in cell wall biosynthesis
MRVSVVIPAFDGERFLADAVASVHAQEYPIHELVVVDDGSTDATASIAGELGARLVAQENQGPAAARNRGIEATTGEAIAFLDCDDLWTPGSLARRVEALEEDAGLQVVLGRHRAEYLPGALLIEFPADEDGTLTSVKFSSGVFRREVFDRVGLLDTSFRQAEDVDWFLRALELRVPMLIVDHVSLVYRRHRANVTCDRDLNQACFARALMLSLERRRKAGGGTPVPLPRWADLDERHVMRSRS